jgi:hypothetical protein
MHDQDPDFLASLVAAIEQCDAPRTDAWIEQTDPSGALRVLVGSAVDLDFGGSALRVVEVKLAGHWTSPIYYLFERRGSRVARNARYLLSHQPPRTDRRWFCAPAQRCVPHLGAYPGDLALVGARFKPVHDVHAAAGS